MAAVGYHRETLGHVWLIHSSDSGSVEGAARIASHTGAVVHMKVIENVFSIEESKAGQSVAYALKNWTALRIEQIGALPHPAAHRPVAQFHAEAPEDLRLPVQGKVVGEFRHDHLRQLARARRALFNRLRWLARGLHRAAAGILFADIFDYDQ
jgi:hypothetical protein